MDSEIIRKLRAKAERCRQLAAKASDGEAADSLLQLAAETFEVGRGLQGGRLSGQDDSRHATVGGSHVRASGRATIRRHVNRRPQDRVDLSALRDRR